MSTLVSTTTMPNGDTANQADQPGWRVVTDAGVVVLADDMTGVTWTKADLKSDSDPDALASSLTAPSWAVGIDYTDGDLATQDGVVWTCRQAHTSEASWAPGSPGTLALWQRIGSTTGTAPWTTSTYYAVNAHVTYNAQEYICLQSHTSQTDWTPDATPALWAPYTPPSGGTSAWAIGVAYAVGDLVTYNGTTYRCLQAHTAQAGWEPPNTPALWQAQ